MQTVIKISARPSKTGRIDKLLLFFYTEKAEVFFNGQMKILFFGPNSVITPLKHLYFIGYYLPSLI